MATSIFNKTNNLYENPNRNTFDLSFQNNLTFNLGQLIPCMVKEVLPGDTVSIDTTIGLKCLPFIFPVQTRMRAHIHHFYVRNRTLWKDWQDFITMSKDNLVPPYLSQNRYSSYFRTGSLCDYLGLPTTVYGPKTQDVVQPSIRANKQNLRISNRTISYNIGDDNNESRNATILFDNRIESLCYHLPDGLHAINADGLMSDIRASYLNKQDTYSFVTDVISSKNRFPNVNDDLIPNHGELASILSNEFRYKLPSDITSNSLINACVYFDGLLYNKHAYEDIPISNNYKAIYPVNGDYFYLIVRYKGGVTKSYVLATESNRMFLRRENIQDDFDIYGEPQDALLLFSINFSNLVLSDKTTASSNYNDISDFNTQLRSNTYTTAYFAPAQLSLPIDNPLEQTDIELPYNSNKEENKIKISALPFRAYEMIYNSFYRDSRNNPRIVDGQPEYNKFITTDEGGSDSTDYHIFNRNWEQDFLTTSVQSPQQGVAPLVGVTSLGEFQFKDEEGKIYTAQAEYASDGDTITSFKINSPDMPVGNLRQLVDSVSYGISISDFRNVNALQRWLEINMRRGIRYQDQIKSHYGVDVKYKDYAYPEFLGGHSEEIYINQINQSTPTDGSPLGSFAGQGGTFGSSPHRIEKYCDEHGYIISIVSVTPVANYSQLLPKHFLKDKPLDYFFPEFGHLSMQPITYKEVCPLQIVNSNTDVKLSDTFGYQRAWYEYLASTDEVHGLFRTSLKNFVVHRVFGNIPTLSNDFLTINHEDIDDVFAVSSDDSSHKLMGQIYFDLKMKRPIPQYGIPKLEV